MTTNTNTAKTNPTRPVRLNTFDLINLGAITIVLVAMVASFALAF